jgi:hypothetical protein
MKQQSTMQRNKIKTIKKWLTSKTTKKKLKVMMKTTTTWFKK